MRAKTRRSLTIYLMSGVKLSGRIKSFDKYSVVLETNNQEQLIFKHAISTVVVSKPFHLGRRSRAPRQCGHARRRPALPASGRAKTRTGLCQRRRRSRDPGWPPPHGPPCAAQLRPAVKPRIGSAPRNRSRNWLHSPPRRARAWPKARFNRVPDADAATHGRLRQSRGAEGADPSARRDHGDLRSRADAHAAAQSGKRAGRRRCSTARS